MLDPFVGSGTTLVETALRGATGRGVDANPLAVDLAALKATPVPAAARDALVERAADVAARSLERVKKRARTKTHGGEYDDPTHYMPHVFRELVGLREEIEGEAEPIRGALLLVLSSILVKVSRDKARHQPRHRRARHRQGQPVAPVRAQGRGARARHGRLRRRRARRARPSPTSASATRAS